MQTKETMEGKLWEAAKDFIMEWKFTFLDFGVPKGKFFSTYQPLC